MRVSDCHVPVSLERKPKAPSDNRSGIGVFPMDGILRWALRDDCVCYALRLRGPRRTVNGRNRNTETLHAIQGTALKCNPSLECQTVPVDRTYNYVCTRILDTASLCTVMSDSVNYYRLYHPQVSSLSYHLNEYVQLLSRIRAIIVTWTMRWSPCSMVCTSRMVSLLDQRCI